MFPDLKFACRTLLKAPEFARLDQRPCLLGGDFNDWRSLLQVALVDGLEMRCATQPDSGARGGLRTYPSFSPQGRLDRLYYRGSIRLASVQVARLRLARVASDHLPVVMLPVRLETKFALDRARDGASLRVRIFPDDIHVSTHDPALSAAEFEAGAGYWSERTRALGLAPEERRVAEEGAWSLIAKRCGGPRARYVARTMKPVGWPAQGAAPPADIPKRDTMNGTPPRMRSRTAPGSRRPSSSASWRRCCASDRRKGGRRRSCSTKRKA